MGLSFSSSSCNPCTSIDEKMNGMIFYPQKSNLNDINRMLRPNDQHIFLPSTDGVKISVYLSAPIHGVHKYLVWAHGNAMRVEDMISYLQNVQDSLGVGFILFDYQGYGCSDGEPSEEKCYDDIEAVMEYALNDLKIKSDDLYLIGASLGTGVVIDYAHNHDWKNPLILISPYKTIVKVVCDSSCVRPIDKFRSEAKLPKLNCPVRIFHGEQDNLIGIEHGRHLFSTLKDKSLEPIWIPNADHNNIYRYIEFDDIREVLNHKIN